MATLLALVLLSTLSAGCTSCVFEGTRSFDVSASSQSPNATDLTIAVLLDGAPLVQRSLHFTAEARAFDVGTFDQGGAYDIRAWTNASSDEETFSYARCGSTAGVSVFVDADGRVQIARAVV